MSNHTTTTANRGESPTYTFESIHILLFLFYGALVIVIVVIFLLRALIPKFSKGHIDVGKYAPKTLREDIDRRLDQTLSVAFEPQLLLDDDKRSALIADYISAKTVSNSALENEFFTEQPCNYLYRMKTVDDIRKLERMLESTDVTLKRHPLKDLRQHLRDIRSHSSGVLNSVPSNQIKALIDMYEQARYNPEVFALKEYQKFAELLATVLAGLERKSRKKRTKKLHSLRNTNSNASTSGEPNRQSNIATSENEPLLVNEETRKNQ